MISGERQRQRVNRLSDGIEPEITILSAVLETPETIKLFIDAIESVMENLCHSYEILLIDDGSSPETWKIIGQKAMDRKHIRGYRLSRNFGKESSIMAGLKLARGRAILIMDADLQHPVELIPKFVSLWNKGKIPIVQGVRMNRRNQRIVQKVFVKGYYVLFGALTGIDLQDSTDFILLDRQVVDHLNQLKERQTYLRGLAHWVGFERVLIPFKIAPRNTGKSGWSIFQQLRHAFLGLSSFSAKPVYSIIFLGITGLLCSLILGIQTLWNYLYGSAEPGFSTVILLQLAFGSMQLFCIGLIGVYIVNIFVEVKHRPRFIIEDKTDNAE